MVKCLLSEIYDTFELWKDSKDKDFYDTYINCLIENEDQEMQNNYLCYWASLKAHYKLKNEWYNGRLH